MLMEIVKGKDEVTPVKNKETGQIRGFTQEAYFDLGDAFPQRGKIRVEDAQGIPPGKYKIFPAYRIGRFGDLEINPFATPEITPAKPEDLKAVG